MKILYLGYLIEESECLTRSGTSIAGNRMQAGLLTALLQNNNNVVEILTIVPTAPFPKEKKVLFKYSTEKAMGFEIKRIPFVNIQILKQITQIFSLLIYIIQWKKNNIKEQNTIICYNSNFTTGLVVFFVKYIFKIDTICFLADPVFNVGVNKGVKKILWKPYKLISNFSLRYFDKLIVVNKNVIAEFAPKLPYLVIEGGFHLKDYVEMIEENPYNNLDEERIVFFAGALYEYNGIRLILEAAEKMSKLRKDVIFVIYGDGELRDEVLIAAKQFSNIQYRGLQPNHVVRKEMMEATILLNIRLTDDPISKYTFPSKVLEYLISGKAIISTRIDGMPLEYKKHLYLLENEDSNSLVEKLNELLYVDFYQFNERGIESREFMINEKEWSKISTKVNNFLNLPNINIKERKGRKK